MRMRLLAAAALAVTSLPAGAQIAPGLRAPESVADGVFQAWLMGCFFAASERPAAGLNIGFELAGEGLHEANRIPDDLRPLIMALADHVRVAVLDAPGGEVWMFHDPRNNRCLVATSPADAPGMAETLAGLVERDGDWRTVADAEGAPAGATVYEQSFPAAPALRRPAATLRVWYQPAAGTSPQMIVTERVRRSRRR